MMESRYNNIADNIARIRERIAAAAASAGRDPAEISLMAVTKTQTAERVNAAIAAGITLLGENRAQELCARFDSYRREGVAIHFIGGLQTNKVRQVAGKVEMVQSLDSLRLAAGLDRQSAILGKTLDVLIEVNIGGEAGKSGLPPGEVADFAEQIRQFPCLRLRGLMAIPPIYDKTCENEKFFYQMQQVFVDIKARNIDNRSIDVLSMGMSGDFEPAVKHGATLVRIGSALFGARA
jgi:pyridoxal phosphate enzyme (YggS family)